MITTPQNDMRPGEQMRTYLQIIAMRKISEEYIKLSHSECSDEQVPDVVFTCDDCPHGAYCAYAFDSYNTDGDCLAMK